LAGLVQRQAKGAAVAKCDSGEIGGGEKDAGKEQENGAVAVIEFGVSFVQPACQPVAACWHPEAAARQAYWREKQGDPYLAGWLAAFAPTHLYLGSEFCEHLLPSPRAVNIGLRQAHERGLRFCLLTPVASPQVIRDLAALLPLLPEDAEVVVNDWGVAGLVRESHPALRRVAGRILCRMIKDPRLPGSDWAVQCGFDFAPLQPLFERAGFQQMETDTPLFADGDAFSRLPLPWSVHLPWFFVAKGRMCRIGALRQQGPERFAVGRRCKKECLGVSARIERPAGPDHWESWQVGNTIFGRHSRAMVDAVMAAVAKGQVQRLVVPGEAL
jgi:hypothetical protein